MSRPRNNDVSMPSPPSQDKASDSSNAWSQVLVDVLSSSRVTVILVVASIILVFLGTLAQCYMDMWEVIDQYFRAWICWVDLKVLFPPSFFPWAAHTDWNSLAVTRFPFPGGALIGLGLVINLVAAHLHRFKPEAQGARLIWGIFVLGVGIVATWLVIAAGHGRHGLQSATLLDWDKIWPLVQIGTVGLWLSCVVAFGYVMKFLDPRRRVERWMLGIFALLLGVLVIWLYFEGRTVALNNSSLRILVQLIQAEAAAVILLFAGILLFRRRAGLVLLHGGIGLMMFGELFVSYFAAEQRIVIREGQTVGYAQDIRSLELAITDAAKSDAATSGVPLMVTGKVTRYARGEAADIEQLPFTVTVVKYFKNASIEPVGAGVKNLATAGLGMQFVAKPVTPKGGVSQGPMDQASAYVRYTRKSDGAVLGTYLHSQLFGADLAGRRVLLDNHPYRVELRFPRDYKSYRITLLDVRKDDYVGTNIPRNYASQIHLQDPSKHVDFDAKIWMNNPLRYAGETFYQSGYNRTKSGEVSILQVVHNTGWMIPYVACMLVGTGMLAHFLLVLLRFLRRVAKDADRAGGTEQERAPQRLAAGRRRRSAGGGEGKKRFQLGQVVVPAIVVLVGVAWTASKVMGPSVSPRAMNLERFEETPLMFEGRVKPFGTLARNTLRILSNRETFADAEGNKQPAIRWLLDLIARPQVAESHRVFRIDSGDVRDTLGLERRAGSRYSFQELLRNFSELQKQVTLARSQPSADRTYQQRKFLDLEQRVVRYQMLVDAFRPLPFPTLPDSKTGKSDRDLSVAKLTEVARLLKLVPAREKRLAARPVPLAVPTDDPKAPWIAYATARDRAYVDRVLRHKDPGPLVTRLSEVFDAYATRDAARFNQSVATYQELVAEARPLGFDARKNRLESFFNHAAPFYNLIPLSILALLLTIFGWLVAVASPRWSGALRNSAFWLLVLILILHTLALAGRVFISGRPPVTNLYSSAIFIGWCCVAIGLILEFVFRYGIGNCVASVSGISALLIAHFLAGGGDTIRVLQAVLDTQFWLTMHVLTVAFGYSAMFLAGALGLLMFAAIWLHDALTLFGRLRGGPAPRPNADTHGWPELERVLSGMIYGTICFAAFASFVGTVLGGLWADDSWGRFWGWDPKENGALMIVLWTAIMLHAKSSHMVGRRGMALLAIGGNIITAWSWFGVNELGIGLHSYGFTEGMARGLLIFWISQLVIIGMGLLYLLVARLRGESVPVTDDAIDPL